MTEREIDRSTLPRQFSIRGILILITLIGIMSPFWIQWYELAVAKSSIVPTNHGDFRKMSPFQAVSVQSQAAAVRIDGNSYELLEINGVKTSQLLRIAGWAFGRDLAEKRFVEDLPAVLNAAGMDGTKTSVDLKVRDEQTQETHVISNVPMTRENRSAVYRARHGI